MALAAATNVGAMVKQILEFRPRAVAMATGEAMDKLRAVLGGSPAEISGVGNDGLCEIATHPDVDVVLCASSGTAALDAVLAAIEAGKTIALANKEVLVMAGGIVMDAARRKGVAVLPVDSEHNAIHQCLHGRKAGELRRLILTASGGPFRGRSLAALETVTAAEALKHPTWQMGPKITIDSATLMNKGLEVIEAHWLFGVPSSGIEVVVHPQSIVHSMVELKDGSIIAQLGITDMRLPIQYAFAYPDRWDAPVPFLDLTRVAAARISPAGLGRLSVPEAGLPRARTSTPRRRKRVAGTPGAAQPADRVERGQRGRRIVFSGGPPRLHADSTGDRAGHGRAYARAGHDAGRGPAGRRVGPDACGRAGAES